MMNSMDKNLFFAGRFKTVKQKQVDYTGESKGVVMNHSLPDDRGSPPAIVPALASGGVLGVSLISTFFPAGPHPLSFPVALAPVVGLPAASWGAANLMDRKVNYVEKQVPMTEAEELAVMTPLERAHWEIDKALKKWQGVREKYQSNLAQLKAKAETVKNDIDALQSSQSGEDHYRALKLAAKQNSHKELTDLALVSKKMLQDLDGQIREKEEALIAAKEKLDMMKVREDVLSLHQQLQNGEQATQSETGLKKDAALQPILEDLEKQKIKLEAIMASVQTAMDVDAVLNSMNKPNQ